MDGLEWGLFGRRSARPLETVARPIMPRLEQRLVFVSRLNFAKNSDVVRAGLYRQIIEIWRYDTIFFFQTLEAPSELYYIHIWRAGRWSPPAG